MTNNEAKTPEPTPVEQKKYEKPALEKLGSVTDLTHGVAGGGSDALVIGSH